MRLKHFRKNKKGELSITVIVVAAIALLVLVILAYLVIKSGSNIREGTKCKSLGGTCLPLEPNKEPYQVCEDNGMIYSPGQDCAQNKVCCIGKPENNQEE